MNDDTADPNKAASLPADLTVGIQNCLEEPENEDHWDRLEELADKHQMPEEAASTYEQALGATASPDIATLLGQRAVRFHNEWFSDNAPLVRVLTRVLAIDPLADWAFERVSLLLTVGERWDELLALYDRALEAATDKLRKRELLDEAAHVAKDFAGQPDRAIHYLEQLYPLKPQDAQLAASLERLLEARGRYRDLIQLWTTRVAVLAPDAAQATRARIAACWLDHLSNPAESLLVIEPLLAGGGEEATACELLERIVAMADAAPATRKRALELVKGRYAAAGRSEDVIRVLMGALSFFEPAAKIEAHHEIAERLSAQGRDAEAMDHIAAIVALDASDMDALEQLRLLAERTGRHAAHADALAAAADSARDRRWAVSLLHEAATVKCDRVGDDAGGIALFSKAFAAPEAGQDVLMSVGRRLSGLLEQNGRKAELLDVLERLATLVTDTAERCALLGKAARLADEQDDLARALRLWERRLGENAADIEALDAIIDLLGRTESWEPLVEALRKRANASQGAQSRDDLVRIGGIMSGPLHDKDRAILAWREVEERFGRNEQTVDALADLLMQAGRWEELSGLLGTAIADEGPGARRAYLLARHGDVYRQKLSVPLQALACYSAALAEEPHNETGREGLRALLHDASCAPEALDALVKAFAHTDEWEQTLALLDQRLQAASSDKARAAILLDAATTQEERGNQVDAALLSVGRALAYDPSDKEIEQELLRLAAKSQNWLTTVEAYHQAIQAAAADPARVAGLRFQRGAILEENLQDLEAALSAYTLVRDAVPGDLKAAQALVRVAARLRKWDQVAQAITVAARAQDAVHDELFHIVEGIAGEDDWDDAVRAMERAVREEKGLSPHVAHALEKQVGVWNRDRRSDAAAAEHALLRAVYHDEAQSDTLRMLADLQRRKPGRALVDTLLKLAAVDAHDLSSLYEAAYVAQKDVGDRELARPILARLYAEASEQWRNGQIVWTSSSPDQLVGWALAELVSVHEQAGEYARAVQLLVDGARLPFDRAAAHTLYHRAADIASAKMADSALAIQLYRTLIAEEPTDAKAITELAGLYRAAGRLSDLIDLHKHELKLTQSAERRLSLRIEIAEAFASLGDVSGRIDALSDNLREDPGHEPSIEALSAALEGDGRFRDLATVLSEQAAILEDRGDQSRAQGLWIHVAGVAEQRLSDIDMALSAYRSAVRLGPSAEALDALARLHTARGEHAQAVGWLEQRLVITPDGERTPVVLKLADALTGAGKADKARAKLEQAIDAAPSAKEIRLRLAALYRASEAWEPLVKLLLEGTHHEDDAQVRLASLTEAADIQFGRLNLANDAVSTLHQAMEIAPQDKNVRASLADALRGAGRLDEAKTILEGLVEEFGRRRPAQRATLHFQLAQVARARGDLNEALHQLDFASEMNMGHAGVLQLLGELAQEAGQLERAEKAYRALLLIVRRQRPGEAASGPPIGQAQVLLQLYRIAQRLEQADRAKELLESAFEIAAQSDEESIRFENALRALGDGELLLRSLEARLARATNSTGQAGVLSEIAKLMEDQGRAAEALDMRMRAMAQAPQAADVRAASRALAAKIGQTQRYIEHLEQLAANAQGSGSNAQAADLYLELGDIAERELSDPARALSALVRAEETGERQIDAWKAMGRVSAAVGDRVTQARVLRKLLESADGLPPEDQTEATYRLAELELSQADTREQGTSTLQWALERDPQFERAAEMLKRAAESGDATVLALYERVARSSGQTAMLLDALERLSALPETPLDVFREAVELATSTGESARSEALLHHAVQRAEQRGESMSDVVWALTALAERRKSENDFAGAVAWMRRAMQNAEADEAFQLGLEVAALAAGPMNDLPLAAKTYEELLERDPSDRAVWEPLLDIYRKLGEESRLEALIASTVDSVLDGSDRRRLRMERARLLLSRGRSEEAVAVLQDILQEDPDDTDTAELLMGVYEKSGRTDDLADLLQRQLEGARSRNEGVAIASLSLKLAALLSPTRREDAIDTLKSALENVPDDRRIIQELLALFRPEDSASDRADVMERMFTYETGERAAQLALSLAAVRASIPDEEGEERALERGYALCPESQALSDRLLQFYGTHERYDKLAAMLMSLADRIQDPATAAAKLREVASLYANQLSDPGSASRALKRAQILVPSDRSLVRDLAHALVLAGDAAGAVEEVSGAIQHAGTDQSALTELLKLRAELYTQRGEEALAVGDLDRALSLGDTSVLPALSDALFQQRNAASDRGDTDMLRASTLRLVDILKQMGEAERSRDLLASWAEQNPHDGAALRALLDLHIAAENFRSVAEICNRLIDIESGDAKVDAALKLADACTREGVPMAARLGMERAFSAVPTNTALRDQLRKLYEQIGAHREHAALYLKEAEGLGEDPARFEALRKAGELLLQSASDAESAISPLEEALRIKPADHETTILLADAYTLTGRLQEATDLINNAIAGHKNRRSREVAVLQHRMARVAAAAGDRSVEVAWLGVAFEADMQNGQIAAELSTTAMELGEFEVALKALRAITMMKNPAPMGRAMAYLNQGKIAHRQGDARRAAILAKKAQTEDPELAEAKEFLQQIGAG